MTIKRWPKSLHSQVEAVFNHIKSFGMKKNECDRTSIRSHGTMSVYKKEAHLFAEYLKTRNICDISDLNKLSAAIKEYATASLDKALVAGKSLNTLKTQFSALNKLYLAVATMHGKSEKCEMLSLSHVRKSAREQLQSSSLSQSRAYPDPLSLILAITNEKHKLMAKIQLAGGCRAEGVGAPSRGKNPMTLNNLLGYAVDIVSKQQVGVIETTEKGGKRTRHYIDIQTYDDLRDYLKRNGQLSSKYQSYLRSINRAAVETGQYTKIRGTHGLKAAFAKMRFFTAITSGIGHERARQLVAHEISHFRLDSVDVYLR